MLFLLLLLLRLLLPLLQAFPPCSRIPLSYKTFHQAAAACAVQTVMVGPSPTTPATFTNAVVCSIPVLLLLLLLLQVFSAGSRILFLQRFASCRSHMHSPWILVRSTPTLPLHQNSR